MAIGRVGQVAYAALFVIVLPLALWRWAVHTVAAVPLPPVHLPPVGWATAGVGLALMAGGMAALRKYGGGLPMNPYPPPVFVTRGVYRVLSHPIYVGFWLACTGVAIAAGSPSGLWLVSPIVALGATALVWGYERHDLVRRFGATAQAPVLLSLPPADDSRPTAWDRTAVVVLVLIPWVCIYEAIVYIGLPRDAIVAWLPFERHWPVLVWTEGIYTSVYPFVVLVPFFARRRRTLRRFAITGLVATGVVSLIYLVVPIVSPARPFSDESLLGRALMLERLAGGGPASFPSFHVIWTLIAAEAWARDYRPAAPLAWGWAAAITMSCITTGMHAVVDILAALMVWPALRAAGPIWSWLRALAERIANSWREWRVGPVRFINHGLYAAAGGGLGVLIAGVLAGPRQVPGVILAATCGLVASGLWAQQLEGSSKLSRPFGYFGGVFGVLAGEALAAALGYDWLLLFGAFSVAAPWIQATGRLRCLVQGCCHGAPAPPSVGIQYRMPRSRVVVLAGWQDIPLHPTPLYSILGNLVIGCLLARLWILGASVGLITGLCFILVGMARFVEESYRGEPQTPIVKGLRLYQWLAISFVVVGAFVTLLPVVNAPHPSGVGCPALWLAAAGVGLACGVAMGVDFPFSNRRFARLAT